MAIKSTLLLLSLLNIPLSYQDSYLSRPYFYHRNSSLSALASAGTTAGPSIEKPTGSSTKKTIFPSGREEINEHYSGPEGTLNPLIFYSALEEGLIKVECSISSGLHHGRLEVTFTGRQADLASPLNSMCTRIDTNNDFYISRAEISQYETELISRLCGVSIDTQ